MLEFLNSVPLWLVILLYLLPGFIIHVALDVSDRLRKVQPSRRFTPDSAFCTCGVILAWPLIAVVMGGYYFLWLLSWLSERLSFLIIKS